jgi:hypothetical protein
MSTAPQRAARELGITGPQLSAELEAALEHKPVPDPEPVTRHRGGKRRRLLRKPGPRHAEDGEKAAREFRSMAEVAPARPRPALPRAVERTGPQPTFTPRGAAGPPRRPRHAGEVERILAIAQRRADSVPVPVQENPVTAKQAFQHVNRLDPGHLQYPAYDAADGYGSVPKYVALMQYVSRATGTDSRYEFPGAWPLPVAPEVRSRGLAITAGDAPAPAPERPGSAGLPSIDPGILDHLRAKLGDVAS